MRTISKLTKLTDYIEYLLERKYNEGDEEIFNGTSSMRNVLGSLKDSCGCWKVETLLDGILLREKNEIKRFESINHKLLFSGFIDEENIEDVEYLAALYLLTSNEGLWAKVRDVVFPETIRFERVKRTLKNDEYTLFKVARDIMEGTGYCSICDFTDADLLSDSVVLLICKAISICRYGIGSLGVDVEESRSGVIKFNK